VEAFPVSRQVLAEAVFREDGGGILVQAPGLTRMERDRFRRTENRQKLARLTQELFGESRPVKIVPAPGTEPVEEQPPAGEETARVRLIKEQFGGEVVKREQPGLFSGGGDGAAEGNRNEEDEER
jgi:hypothetical protein